MELLGDVSLMESRFGPFGDSVGVGPRSVHGLRHTYHWLINRFGRTWWNSLVTWVVESRFRQFGDNVSIGAI